MESLILFYIVSLVVLVALVLLLWPGGGYLSRWRRLARLSRRVHIEDGLKHLYDCEYRNRTASVESLAGALEVKRSRAAEVLIQLESMGLASTQETGAALTSAGRDEALRIVRIHRLWERYLAERTGVSRAHWHEEAEHQEHHMSVEETETLSQEMGHPAYDPHGDPIPTAEGDVPPRRSLPLTSLKVGEIGRIEHVEDEPEDVYQRLTDAGLHDSLDDLEMGECAHVVRISPACRGLERRRLMDIGLVPGTAVSLEMRSPMGDPMAYQIRGATIALRRHQARHVQVERDLGERRRQ